MGADPPIIITGGSITIDLDPNNFKNQGNGKYANQDKRITRVEITGDGMQPIAQDINNGKCVIKVYYTSATP